MGTTLYEWSVVVQTNHPDPHRQAFTCRWVVAEKEYDNYAARTYAERKTLEAIWKALDREAYDHPNLTILSLTGRWYIFDDHDGWHPIGATYPTILRGSG